MAKAAEGAPLEVVVGRLVRGADLPDACVEQALHWCMDVGAASLNEVLDASRELELHLNLKPLEQQRFRRSCEATRAASSGALFFNRSSRSARRRGSVTEEELVPGMAALLQAALLGECLQRAEQWAEEVGVDSLDELIEYGDELEDHLQLSFMDRRRLRQAMAARRVASAQGGGSRGGMGVRAGAPVSTTWLDLAQLLADAQLSELLQDTRLWCEDNGVKTLEELASLADKFERQMVHNVVDQRRFRKALVARVRAAKITCAPGAFDVGLHGLPGLTEVLSAARLTNHLNAALAWCAEMGPAGLWEIAEDPEDLMDRLGLKDMERRRFQQALDATASEPPSSAEAPDVDSEAGASTPLPVPGLDALLARTRLRERRLEVAAWCDEVGASTIDDITELQDELVQQLELRPLEVQRISAALKCLLQAGIPRMQLPPMSDVMEAGLVEIMEKALLSERLPEVRAWCQENSVVELEDMEAHAAILEEVLRLKVAEQARFRRALAAAPAAAADARRAAQARDREAEAWEEKERRAEQRRRWESEHRGMTAEATSAQRRAQSAEHAAAQAELEAVQLAVQDMQRDLLDKKQEARSRVQGEMLRDIRVQERLWAADKEWHAGHVTLNALRAEKEQADAERARILAARAKAKARGKGKAKAKSKAKAKAKSVLASAAQSGEGIGELETGMDLAMLEDALQRGKAVIKIQAWVRGILARTRMRKLRKTVRETDDVEVRGELAAIRRQLRSLQVGLDVAHGPEVQAKLAAAQAAASRAIAARHRAQQAAAAAAAAVADAETAEAKAAEVRIASPPPSSAAEASTSASEGEEDAVPPQGLGKLLRRAYLSPRLAEAATWCRRELELELEASVRGSSAMVLAPRLADSLNLKPLERRRLLASARALGGVDHDAGGGRRRQRAATAS